MDQFILEYYKTNEFSVRTASEKIYRLFKNNPELEALKSKNEMNLILKCILQKRLIKYESELKKKRDEELEKNKSEELKKVKQNITKEIEKKDEKEMEQKDLKDKEVKKKNNNDKETVSSQNNALPKIYLVGILVPVIAMIFLIMIFVYR